MARFRLKAKHYLSVPDTEWEHKEVLSTGKQKRIMYPVPLYLDPDNPNDQTPPGSGEILVSTKPNDGVALQFFGKCTPDMEPLDDEAEEMFNTTSKDWVHPIDGLPVGSEYGAARLEQFMSEFVKMRNEGGGTVAPADDGRFEAMQKQLAALMEKNAQLEERLDATAPTARR